MIQPVILCGGSGTRLWPLSRRSFPKQFVPLIDGKSLLQLTLERVLPLADGAAEGVICVGSEEHRFLIAEAMETALAHGSVILEPAARNTAAAMAVAALHAASQAQLLLYCPADHHIPDAAGFQAMVRKGVAMAMQGAIVTFGVTPTFPNTGYGYIERGAAHGVEGCYLVKRFVEKPTFDVAQKMVLEGRFCWNAGVFLCTAGAVLQAMRQHAPDILASCRQAMKAASTEGAFIQPEARSFSSCRSASINYTVMEHHSNVAMVAFEGAWCDVGSWNEIADLVAPDECDNRIVGDGLAIDSTKTFIHAPNRPVVALGTHDLLIIDTSDALLVAARSAAEQVKDVVSQLVSRRTHEAAFHRKVDRPWGWYDSIENGERFQVKRISVKPGASLSLQKHHHRAEHWVVVRGTAQVTRGSEVFLLNENQSTFIPLGEIHRLHNPGKAPLEMIEVQSGSYLGEDDIVRFDDNYGRMVSLDSKS